MLKFDNCVSDICKKASKQLAVLKRYAFLTKQGISHLILATVRLHDTFVVHQSLLSFKRSKKGSLDL